MDKQQINRLNYLRKNYDFLSDRERLELVKLEGQYNNGLAQGEGNGSILSHDQADLSKTQSLPEQQPQASSFTPPQVSRRARANQKEAFLPKPKKLSPMPKTTEKGRKSAEQGEGIKTTKKRKKHHIFRNIALILLALILIMGSFFAYGYARGNKLAGGAVKAEKFDGAANQNGATNILLIGADQRPNNAVGSVHSDSIMVLQVGAKDGKMKLVSFMRDTLVNVPTVSETGVADNKINLAYTVGEQSKPRAGAELLRQTLLTNFGINCKYYAVVDFASFSQIIDTLFPSGVEIDAQFSTINGETVDEVPVPDDLVATLGMVKSDKELTADEAYNLGYPDGGGVFMMIKKGKQKMNGRTLLNYARFRHDDENDFGRVKRQQQVMKAVIGKLKNPLILFTGSSALGTARAIIETNIPNSFFLTHGLGMIFSASQGMESYSVPDLADVQAGKVENAYDMYGGLGLAVDTDQYKEKLGNILGQ